MECGLYIVPTPIGNLSDMTARAVDVLRQVDFIAAEDTRHSRKLLSHYDIDTPLRAYHEHVDDRVTEEMAELVVAGGAMALISDAGTPLVSDPGFRLVRAVQAGGARVIPLPGPCAAIAALSGSGLPTDRFSFEGFLPTKSAQRRERIQDLRDREGTLVFYEAPHRILATLDDAVAIFGPEREGVLARELTKTFETIRRLPLGLLRDWVAGDSDQQRGEQVLMIGPAAKSEAVLDATATRLVMRLAKDLPPRKAAAIVAELTGIKSRRLYDFLLENKSSP